MGRTLLPYTLQVEKAKSRLADFRRSLRKEEQESFDELMRYAKAHQQAGVMAALPNPIDAMLVSMLISLQIKMDKHNQKMTNLEKIISKLDFDGGQK